jgi:hypothetical protein
MFHTRAELALCEFEHSWACAAQLASGEKISLRVAVGDLFPRPPILERLSRFFV